MSTPRLAIESLRGDHDRTAFSSGSPALDRYFRQQAGQEHRRRATAVFIAIDTAREGAIAGFYTLSAATVDASALPQIITSKLPRYPVLPAILLGRLARDERWRGEGIGEILLTNAFRRSLEISEQLGALFLIVEAKDDAAQRFYERYQFEPLVHQERLLFLPLAVVRRFARLGNS